ncbi:MAG: bifunctional proline dehydrogenase/L-glutamate gamma-semialdehyde dehydrogenase [Desulfobacterales bacterium]|jgi:RHH-type proline utilization regulon transcriptional repressor/proline dehydrogenase/delta 1-pyrroline-5-carboxylate dehydrogenase
MEPSELDPAVNNSLSIARAWQDRANELLTSEEKGIQEQMEQLMTHPIDKAVLTKMIDQSFRPRDPSRVADQVNAILTSHGIPDFFPRVDRLLIQMFLGFGRHFPAFTVPKMIKRMRGSSSRAIIPGEKDALHAHLLKRKKQGVRMNINHLGEALLGEKEASRRLDTYIEDMKNPEIEYISVKISTIYSQILPIAFDHTVKTLKERLSELYSVAGENVYVRSDGTKVPKFVNLDMEEYRDLDITKTAFMETLDQEPFKNYSAGIVLQAYLPDSYNIQKELTEWAKNRVDAGGSPIKIRIVKGANMEMEQVESSIFNWPLAPYNNKLEVDANYKRMVEYGLRPENVKAVQLGIASHNLFELAFASKLAEERNLTDYFYFEMLEGMADHVRRALSDISGDVLLYAPVAKKDEFISAIAYLIRRLDENTAGENFLRYSCNLKTGSREWEFLQEQFLASVEYMDKASKTPNRTQNRTGEIFPEKMGTYYENEFHNEPDTDWSLSGNREWAKGIRKQWKKGPGDEPVKIPVVVAGQEIFDDRQIREYMDLSSVNEKTGDAVCVGQYALGNADDARHAVETAKADPDGWREKTARERHEILSRAAMEMRYARARLIGAAAANTGKVFTEADVEVSEAVDFTEYYPSSVKKFDDMENLQCKGKGVALVITPWNFPIAIPCGGMVSSLAAGNTVIFKPASAAVMVAWELCQCLWNAGVSKNTLQFIPCSGSQTGSKLTMHPDVDSIVLTGGTDTGMHILNGRPDVFLAAETGGKNATIVTAMADKDQAIKNVVQSAFGNCGQKCSATSLLILEKEVYEDKHFKQQLVDAAHSFKTGPAWQFRNKMGPLVNKPDEDLKRALTTLEPGETWALKPENLNDNPYMWTPGIKYDVKPGSYTHMTEFFGPVLAVMKAEDLDHAMKLVNQTGYGLTSGLESLDKREQEKWKQQIKAGNLYINRGTTGAVVLRQPFGGMGKSALGAGIKVGGPNYVSQFMEFEETGGPPIGAIRNESYLLWLAREWKVELLWGKHEELKTDLEKTVQAIKSYIYNFEQEFSQEKDYFNLRGQDNILRYLPVGTVLVRLHEDDSLFDVLGRIAAVKVSGCGLVISIPTGLKNKVTDFLNGKEGKRIVGGAPVVHQSDSELIQYIPKVQRIRYASPDRVPAAVLKEAAKTGFYISRTKVFMEGRLELLQYFQEQSICDNYHRYGNLGDRAMVID